MRSSGLKLSHELSSRRSLGLPTPNFSTSLGELNRPFGNLVKALDPLHQESILIHRQVQVCPMSEVPMYFLQLPADRPRRASPPPPAHPRDLPTCAHFTKPCFWESLRNNKETEEKSREKWKEREKPERASEEQEAERTTG